MNQKKRFVSPRVVKEVQIQLEKDLLTGLSAQYRMTVSAMEQDLEVFDFAPGTAEDPNEYTADWD